MECRNCGAVLENEKFCPQCGEKIISNETADATAKLEKTKKGGCLKFFFLGVIGVIVVLFIIGLLSDEGNSTDTSKNDSLNNNIRQFQVLEGTSQATLDALSELCSKIKPIEEIEPAEYSDGKIYYSLSHNIISKDLTLTGTYICVIGVVDYVDIYEQSADGSNLYRYDIITGEVGQANIGPARYITYECFSKEKYNLNDPVIVTGSIASSDLISVSLLECTMELFQ